MKNKNIFLHVIDQDYKDKKQKQNEHPDVSGKSLQLTEIKDNTVVEQLKKMHGPFQETTELEASELTNELSQTRQLEPTESMNSLDVSELYLSFQNLKTEEQELLARKQDLLSIEQNLREKLLTEVIAKKKAIEALNLEISTLQNTCKEISEGLQLNNQVTN